jgi:hypothetical protein
MRATMRATMRAATLGIAPDGRVLEGGTKDVWVTPAAIAAGEG